MKISWRKLEGIVNKSWDSFINEKTKHLCSKEALEFLSQLLIYDHSKRILPQEAMKLDYFKPVRKYHEEKMKD